MHPLDAQYARASCSSSDSYSFPFIPTGEIEQFQNVKGVEKKSTPFRRTTESPAMHLKLKFIKYYYELVDCPGS